MSVRTVAFRLTCGRTIRYSGDYQIINYPGYEEVYGNTYRAIYCWHGDVLPGDITITSAKIVFDVVYDADATIDIGYNSTTLSDPCNTSAITLWDYITGMTTWASAYINDTSGLRKKMSVDIGSSYFTQLRSVFASNHQITLGLKIGDLSPSEGPLYLSSHDTPAGGWGGAAQSNEPRDPPVLMITYEEARIIRPTFGLQYTSQVAGLSQSTPENSIGGFCSINPVYDSASLSQCIGPREMSVPVDTLPPVGPGLASVGPEVVRYSSTVSEPSSLLLSERNVGSYQSVSLGIDAYGDFEPVYYLPVDKLFNTPATETVQYRCLSFVHSGPDICTIKDVGVSLNQRKNSKTMLSFAVESPAWQSLLGTQEREDGGDGIYITDTAHAAGKPDGFYNGGYIYFKEPMSVFGRISSYTSDGSFVLTSSVGDIVIGQNYILLPGPSQRLVNDHTEPLSYENLSAWNNPGARQSVTLVDRTAMQTHDCFYIWLRRTLTPYSEEQEDSGAILSIRYKDEHLLISGRIMSGDTGLPQSGVSIGGTLTAADGTYAIESAFGSSLTVTPTGNYFYPTSRAYTRLIDHRYQQDYLHFNANPGYDHAEPVE